MLLKDKKVFFIHIPKTVGTTFKNILYENYSEDEICPIWDESILFKNHSKYKLFHGHFDFDVSEKFEVKPVLITFLRDPLEISYYYYMRSLPDEVVNASHDEAA